MYEARARRMQKKIDYVTRARRGRAAIRVLIVAPALRAVLT